MSHYDSDKDPGNKGSEKRKSLKHSFQKRRDSRSFFAGGGLVVADLMMTGGVFTFLIAGIATIQVLENDQTLKRKILWRNKTGQLAYGPEYARLALKEAEKQLIKLEKKKQKASDQDAIDALTDKQRETMQKISVLQPVVSIVEPVDPKRKDEPYLLKVQLKKVLHGYWELNATVDESKDPANDDILIIDDGNADTPNGKAPEQKADKKKPRGFGV